MNLGTLIEQIAAAEDTIASLRAEIVSLEAACERGRSKIQAIIADKTAQQILDALEAE